MITSLLFLIFWPYQTCQMFATILFSCLFEIWLKQQKFVLWSHYPHLFLISNSAKQKYGKTCLSYGYSYKIFDSKQIFNKSVEKMHECICIFSYIIEDEYFRVLCYGSSAILCEENKERWLWVRKWVQGRKEEGCIKKCTKKM